MAVVIVDAFEARGAGQPRLMRCCSTEFWLGGRFEGLGLILGEEESKWCGSIVDGGEE